MKHEEMKRKKKPKHFDSKRRKSYHVEGAFNGSPITRLPTENEKGIITNCNFYSCVQAQSSKNIESEGRLRFHYVESVRPEEREI